MRPVVEFCKERRLLLEQYAAASEKWAALSRQLSDAAVSLEVDAFEHFLRQCREAQNACAETRSRLRAHTAAHRCIRISLSKENPSF